ncbi:MAG TPA: hypothetical protein VEC99_17080 [Clostridia bacterium]|nr:hypothetical protein [Clostridia bacterium]
MEKRVTGDKLRINRPRLVTEEQANPPLVFPPAAKYELTYTKANGETMDYLISNPIEEDAESFTAYVFGRGVRTFIKSRVSRFSKVT